jgi:hypothetical protein
LTANPSKSGANKAGRERLPEEEESRPAVALTVVWMLTCTSTAAGLIVVLALRLLMLLLPAARGGAHPLASVAGMLLLVSLTTGVVCLLLTPLAYRVRRDPPPRAITIAAILIGLAPIVTIAIDALRAQ